MENSEMIYGTRAVMEAIKAQREIEKIFIQAGLNNDLIKELINTAKTHHVPFSFIPQQKLSRLSSKNHQGVICMLSAIRYVAVENLIDKAYAEGRAPFLLILDRVTDVRNFGAMARTAECAGLDGIVIEEKGNAPITGDAVKTSAGALNYLPICRVDDLKKTLKLLQDNGIQVVACTEKASNALYELDLRTPTALILGSEEDGISDALLRSADAIAKIPMKGKIGSLNVSVAAGIAIYEVVRQQLKKIEQVQLLKQLCEIHAPSGNEGEMKEFLLRFIKTEKKRWKVNPELVHGDHFQNCLMLKFGKPRTAIFAHMDSVGFTVRYANQLLSIGSPDAEMGTTLVGRDSKGAIACELEYDKENHAFYKFNRPIDRGTTLTYQIDFRDSGNFVQSAYLDNRLGIYNVLKVAETLQNGVIAFSCWEEHGGGSVPFLAAHMYEQWGIRQALISDITWVSDGVEHGKGVAISLRDRNIPRREFTDRIVSIAKKHKVAFQLEVEGVGSSDGGELQRTAFPFDWCFVGAPEKDPHTPNEKVHKKDIGSMIKLYQWLMKEL